MAASPKEILKAILANPSDSANVSAHVAADATYVSLNFSNPALKRVMPWAGTSTGPKGIVQTFVDVARYWNERRLEEIALFGDDRYAALFGRMTYRSTVLGKNVISPFCVYIEAADGVCTHMQFMEDTFATANSFRSGGEWLIRSDPKASRSAFSAPLETAAMTPSPSTPNAIAIGPNLSDRIRARLKTLDLWSQVVGKVRLMLTPWENHGWCVPLRLSAPRPSKGQMT